MAIQINSPLKYPAHGARDITKETIDGLPNFFHFTNTPDGAGQAQLESGFNPMAPIRSKDGERRPSILIRTSSNKAGSSQTPWHDSYDMQGGRVRYFGDAKPQHMPDLLKPKGNKAMVLVAEQHRSSQRETRLQACPLLFFLSPRSGIVEFRGIGVVEGVSLVSQVDAKTGISFSNYAYDCALLSLAAEGEQLGWEWISKRKDSNISDEEALSFAPQSWQQWVNNGNSALSRLRRTVSRLGVTKKEDQLPAPGSVEESVLNEIYHFYSRDGNRSKHRFEALAELVADFVISETQGKYKSGWVTRGTGDHGVDFVGRIDIGSGFSTTSLVVLGQAKCESLTTSTSGKDVARTVARLRRGWIGCYVTTGTFSENVQQEVTEDRYPLIMIPGAKVAEAVRTLSHQDGLSISEFLNRVDQSYESRLQNREPEQVLVL
jgi:hypothetical protein